MAEEAGAFGPTRPTEVGRFNHGLPVGSASSR